MSFEVVWNSYSIELVVSTYWLWTKVDGILGSEGDASRGGINSLPFLGISLVSSFFRSSKEAESDDFGESTEN